MKLGRNDPCECGSRKKHKNCCLGKSNPHLPRSATPTLEELNLLGELFNTGRYVELENLARILIEVNQYAGVVWKLLALSLRMQGKASLPAMQKAAELLPDDAEAHNNLANVLREFGQLDAALASYRYALKIRPDFVDALNNLANLLLSQGEAIAALDIIVHSMQIEEKGARSIFVDCVKRLSFSHVSDFVRDAIVRALSEPWCRPAELMDVAINIVKLNPVTRECVSRVNQAWPQQLSEQDLFGSANLDSVINDPLLIALLKSAPICDIELERFLTMTRQVMLNYATVMIETPEGNDSFTEFHSALAQQCFINEFAFSYSEQEIAHARTLQNILSNALELQTPIPSLCLLALATYIPLDSIPLANQLLDKELAPEITAVVIQQVCEPEEERQYRSTIPHLTAIQNKVSLLVQNQYEENPYPRWVKAAPAGKPVGIDEALSRNFSLSRFQPLGKNNGLDILIAGCGTGQHSIATAQNYRGAKVLAIDLSLTSLCYAKRKTHELGLTMIEYAQADILSLGSLGQNFDLIESIGVLHHLDVPTDGWTVLLSLLRPNGIMKLGFYSDIARRDIVRARTFIDEQGYTSSSNDIRRCRQELMNSNKNDVFGNTTQLGDFFSISACRDLLFHVQEHRMTLASIDSFLQKNNLKFLGFEIDAVVRHAYKLRFPDDPAATNLAHWGTFENENPDTFVGMYRLCVQKA